MHKILLLSALFVGSSLLSPATATNSNNIKEAIIERCRADMGQYGANMVKTCVDMDIEAVASLSEYPDAAQDIIARCVSQMRDYGWNMVKTCVDMDVEAEEALSNY